MSKRKAEDKKSKVVWTDEEDDALLKAVLEDKQNREAEEDADEEEDWDEISKAVAEKSAVQCFKRYIQKFKDAPVKSDSTAAAPESESQPPEEGKGEDSEQVDEDEDEDEDEDSGSPKQSKKSKQENAPYVGWKSNEVELLKKLVEQYKDSKLTSKYSSSTIYCLPFS
jgi:hypothetical protein